ncbi:hypothetical protein QQF64_013693 [Cirrhinus molitorella]|uniref:Uncharacterized protein n=1 Tax=Cirrhinus molitorella TaxID=172907 RepID=A0ABR3LRW7_9TELE
MFDIGSEEIGLPYFDRDVLLKNKGLVVKTGRMLKLEGLQGPLLSGMCERTLGGNSETGYWALERARAMAVSSVNTRCPPPLPFLPQPIYPSLPPTFSLQPWCNISSVQLNGDLPQSQPGPCQRYFRARVFPSQTSGDGIVPASMEQSKQPSILTNCPVGLHY